MSDNTTSANSRKKSFRLFQNKIFKKVIGLFVRASEDHVGAYAAQGAYFMVISFIPFILFLTTMIKYTPLTYKMLREAIIAIIPQNVQGFVLGIVSEVYQKRTPAVVPVAALTALWSAAKAIQSLSNGLNTINHVKETRSWLSTRIRAVFFTFLFATALIVSLLLNVLGGRIQVLAMYYVPAIGRIIGEIMDARTVLVFLMIFLVFLGFFKYLPNKKMSLLSQVPGALFTAFSWSVFSYLFSLYFNLFSSFTNMYGSLASLMMVMLWIDICMILVLYGAEINANFRSDFSNVRYFVVRSISKSMKGKNTTRTKAEKKKQKKSKIIEENKKVK